MHVYPIYIPRFAHRIGLISYDTVSKLIHIYIYFLSVFQCVRSLYTYVHIGYMVNTELDNVVTNILEASEIVERESMISSNNQK
jgi:hypothetical protein